MKFSMSCINTKKYIIWNITYKMLLNWIGSLDFRTRSHYNKRL